MERPLIVFNIAGTPARGVNASLAHKRSPRRMPGASCMDRGGADGVGLSTC